MANAVPPIAMPTIAVVKPIDRKSTRLNSSHVSISYAVFCLKKKRVNLVLSGHEHVYERIKPQDNKYYLVIGNYPTLMINDLKWSDQMQKGLDSYRGFMLIVI